MAGKKPTRKQLIREGALRHSGAHFLASLAVLIVVSPFVEDRPHGLLIEVVLVSVVLVTSVLAVGGRRSTLVWAVVLLTPAMFTRWLNFWWPQLLPSEWHLGAALLFSAFVVLHLLRFILRAPVVNSEVLCTAVANYLMLAMTWSFAYSLVATMIPDAFSFSSPERGMPGFNSLYFSISTLCTVGYGDITPVSRVARMLAMTEAIVGMFYMTVLVARLVSLYSSEARAADPGAPDDAAKK